MIASGPAAGLAEGRGDLVAGHRVLIAAASAALAGVCGARWRLDAALRARLLHAPLAAWAI